MNGEKQHRSEAINILHVIEAAAVMIILSFCFALPVHADTYTYTDDSGINWEYSYFAQMIQINGCDTIPDSGELRIPAIIDGEPVRQIAYRAFADNEDIKDIKFPDSLLYIGNQAFLGCGISSLECPENLIRLGEQSFQHCEKLTTVTFNDKLETIESNAFAECTGITDIHITENINLIQVLAFNRCTALKYVTVDSENQFYKAVDNVLYSKDGDILVMYPPARAGTLFSVPDGVAEIGEYSFNGANLRSVTIPSTVHVMDNGAFYNCSSLNEVVFESTEEGEYILSSIGNYAFYGCTSLIKIELPDTVRSIGEDCFASSTSLTVVKLPDELESIGTQAFMKTNIDQNFSLPPGVKTIQTRTFYNCKNLKHFIVPDTVQSIEDYAFSYCLELKDIYISSDTTTIGNNTFLECGPYDYTLQKRLFALSGSADSVAASYAEECGIGFSVLTAAEYTEAIESDQPVYNFDQAQEEVSNVDDENNASDDTTESGTKKISAKEKIKKSKKLAKPIIKAKNKKGRKNKLSWNKVKGADGYLLYVKGPKDKKYVRRVTMSAKVKSITHKGLAKGKKYKYKIAAYKVVNGKKVRGLFSKTITVKVKK